MAQWYTQLIFSGNTFLGDSLEGWQEVEGILPPGLNGVDRVTAVIVSGYSLYGQLHGYYALGVSHIAIDPASGKAYYLSEQSALHQAPLDSLTPIQMTMIRDWLSHHYPAAWENSTDVFKRSLEMERK